MEKTKKPSVRAREIVRAIRELAAKLRRTPTQAEAIMSGKMNDWEIRSLFGSYPRSVQAAKLPPPPPIPSAPSAPPIPVDKETQLNLRIKSLEQERGKLQELLTEAETLALSAKKLEQMIGSAGAFERELAPEWLEGAKQPKGSHGTPFLFLSDIHYSEVVKKSQVASSNEYNIEIADRRIRRTFQTTIQLLKGNIAKPIYDGIVCALGGDILSGNIHEELTETNEMVINQAILSITEKLIEGIGSLADEFGKVFVPCTFGNHGRMHRKPRAKNRSMENYEWLVYQYVAKYFRNDSRIEFLIPESADTQFSLYNRSLLLTHGDQFQGGSGISGLFSPLMLGIARKQRRQQAIGLPFDMIFMGHWHQLIQTDYLVVNGSVKGYDEYAFVNNLPFERPQQALMVFHQKRRLTFQMAIHCDP